MSNGSRALVGDASHRDNNPPRVAANAVPRPSVLVNLYCFTTFTFSNYNNSKKLVGRLGRLDGCRGI
jgi:hypothetical protein